MNGTTIAGIVVMFFGGLLMSDYKRRRVAIARRCFASRILLTILL